MCKQVTQNAHSAQSMKEQQIFLFPNQKKWESRHAPGLHFNRVINMLKNIFDILSHGYTQSDMKKELFSYERTRSADQELKFF